MTGNIPGRDAPDEDEVVTIIFRKPVVRPGSLEAQAAACLCRFEVNMEPRSWPRISDARTRSS